MSSPVHPSALVKDKHYVSVCEVAGVKTRKYLGAFQSLQLIGRPYDPDAVLTFALPQQSAQSFFWNMRDLFYEVEPPSETGGATG